MILDGAWFSRVLLLARRFRSRALVVSGRCSALLGLVVPGLGSSSTGEPRHLGGVLSNPVVPGPESASPRLLIHT